MPVEVATVRAIPRSRPRAVLTLSFGVRGLVVDEAQVDLSAFEGYVDCGGLSVGGKYLGGFDSDGGEALDLQLGLSEVLGQEDDPVVG